MESLFSTGYFYFFTIGLQAICALHCVRKGSQNKWIYMIVFLPVIGSIAYIYTEMLTRNQIQNVQSGVNAIIRPTATIRKLEERLRFSDTFNNRIMLADAYFGAGNIDRAIELYESSLTGTFTENEFVLTQLVYTYYEKQRFDDIVKIVPRIYKLPQFAKSRAHTIYAIALEKTGQSEMAQKEFKTMTGRYSNYENRYNYGLFLNRAGRLQDARSIFGGIADEGAHMNRREKRDINQWINKAREELKRS